MNEKYFVKEREEWRKKKSRKDIKKIIEKESVGVD